MLGNPRQRRPLWGSFHGPFAIRVHFSTRDLLGSTQDYVYWLVGRCLAGRWLAGRWLAEWKTSKIFENQRKTIKSKHKTEKYHKWNDAFTNKTNTFLWISTKKGISQFSPPWSHLFDTHICEWFFFFYPGQLPGASAHCRPLRTITTNNNE